MTQRKIEATMTFFQVKNEGKTIMIGLVGLTIGINMALQGKYPFNVNDNKIDNPLLFSAYIPFEVLEHWVKKLDEKYPGIPSAICMLPLFKYIMETDRYVLVAIRPSLAESIVAIDASWEQQVNELKTIVEEHKDTIGVEPGHQRLIGKQVVSWKLIEIDKDISTALMLLREYMWAIEGKAPLSALPLEIAARAAIAAREEAL